MCSSRCAVDFILLECGWLVEWWGNVGFLVSTWDPGLDMPTLRVDTSPLCDRARLIFE